MEVKVRGYVDGLTSEDSEFNPSWDLGVNFSAHSLKYDTTWQCEEYQLPDPPPPMAQDHTLEQYGYLATK